MLSTSTLLKTDRAYCANSVLQNVRPLFEHGWQQTEPRDPFQEVFQAETVENFLTRSRSLPPDPRDWVVPKLTSRIQRRGQELQQVADAGSAKKPSPPESASPRREDANPPHASRYRTFPASAGGIPVRTRTGPRAGARQHPFRVLCPKGCHVTVTAVTIRCNLNHRPLADHATHPFREDFNRLATRERLF